MKNKFGVFVCYGVLLMLACFIQLLRNHRVESQKYTLQESLSAITWSGHFNDRGISHGTIPVKGELSVSEKGRISGGEFRMTFAILSDNNLAKSELEAQLIHYFQNSDIFSMGKYPEVDFKITSILPDKHTPGAYYAIGDLTILGRIIPVEFPVVITFSSGKVEVTGKVISECPKQEIGGARSKWPNVGECTNSVIDIRFKLVALKMSNNYQLMY